MAIAPILVFPNWKKQFHVHVDPSFVTLGIVLKKPGEGVIDNPIEFSNIKMSTIEKNYTTTEREGLVVFYALQKLRHYLLGGHFKMYIDHLVLKYLVNKPVLGEISINGSSCFNNFILKSLVNLVD